MAKLTVGAVPVLLPTASGGSSLAIYNQGPDVVYIDQDAAVSPDSGFPLRMGEKAKTADPRISWWLCTAEGDTLTSASSPDCLDSEETVNLLVTDTPVKLPVAARTQNVTIFNFGVAPVFIGSDSAVSAAKGFPLMPGDRAATPDSRVSWWLCTAGAEADVRYIQGLQVLASVPAG